MSAELLIRDLPGERPLDGPMLGVAALLPRAYFALDGRSIAETTIQALAPECSDLDFGHVQPTGVLRGVVKHHPPQQPLGGLAAERFDEAFAEMDVEVVDDEMDAPGRAIDVADEVLGERNEIELATMRGHLRHPVSASRLDRDEDIAGTGPHVFVIHALGLPWRRRERLPTVAQQLLALLVEANHRLVRPVGPSVQVQQFVHAPPVLRGEPTHAPHQLAPRFEAVFFSSRRIVSRLMSSIPGRRRAFCSSSTRVHRLAPAGGAEQLSAVISASTSVSYWRGAPGRAASRSAYSKPPSKYAARVRQMAVRPTPSTRQIMPSGTFSSSAAKMCARLTVRAWRRPLLRHSASALRSLFDSVSSVWRMAVPSAREWEHGHYSHVSLFTC